MENEKIECILTILFGWLGIHKFVKNQKKLGIFYFCTFGLFGIGWIIDSINSIKKIINVSHKIQIKNDLDIVNIKKHEDLNNHKYIKELNKLKDKTVKDINIDYTYLLTQREYNQLQVFNRLNDFNKIYRELKIKNKNFKKNDALWEVYNNARLEYESKKDTTMLSVVFDRQSDILASDRKYDQSLMVFASSLYLILYEFDSTENNVFDLHINKRRKDKLKKLLTKTNKTMDDFEKEFEIYIQEYIPSLYDSSKVKNIINNIVKRIK